MLGLRTSCVHPETNKPYIVSSSGGVDNSPEGAQVRLPTIESTVRSAKDRQGGLTHGFVVEFASKDDRDYYVEKDPSHKKFQEKNGPRFDDVRVLDYEKGVY